MTTRQAGAVVPPPSHARCIACGPDNVHSLGLVFHPLPDGGVRTHLTPSHNHEGYRGQIHGGTIATLLDAAMTHCLFARGVEAMTAELTVRYHRPVRAESEARLTAVVVSRHRYLYQLSAELRQNGRVVATATSKFLEVRSETE